MKRKIIIIISTVILTYLFVLLVSAILQRGPSQDDLKKIATKSYLITLNTALDMFKSDSGAYPEKDHGLKYLVEDCGTEKWMGPYLKPQKVPLDYWKNEFRYDLVNGVPIIISAGKDGEFGTKDDVETSRRTSLKK